jgi:hypothetical protein
MREIKFRVWDKAGNTWHGADDDLMINPYGDVYEIDSYVCCGDNPKDELDKENLIIEQFIGLKDKNGKEIFEGDIVRDDRKEVFKIEMGRWCCHCCYSTYGYYLGDANNETEDNQHDLEIIGNIHENKELLEPQ